MSVGKAPASGRPAGRSCLSAVCVTVHEQNPRRRKLLLSLSWPVISRSCARLSYTEVLYKLPQSRFFSSPFKCIAPPLVTFTGSYLIFVPHTVMYHLSLSERAPLAATLIAINAVFVVLTAIALCIRCMSRRIQGVQLNFNDYAALLAWVRIVMTSLCSHAPELITKSL